MESKLHDFSEKQHPELHLRKPIRHPTNPRNIIGHTGTDKARRVNVAAFPRKKSEHWFRGQSSSNLTGYGLSCEVLDRLDRPGIENISRVLIIETDNGRVIEYDRSIFRRATLVAYAPEENESVIGKEGMRVDDDVYSDKQRVVPVDSARNVFDREAVTILQ